MKDLVGEPFWNREVQKQLRVPDSNGAGANPNPAVK